MARLIIYCWGRGHPPTTRLGIWVNQSCAARSRAHNRMVIIRGVITCESAGNNNMLARGCVSRFNFFGLLHWWSAGWMGGLGGIELLILVFTGLTIHSFFMAKCKLEKTFLPGENTAEPKTKQRASEIYQLFPTRFLVPKSFMMFPHVFVPQPKNMKWFGQSTLSPKKLPNGRTY